MPVVRAARGAHLTVSMWSCAACVAVCGCVVGSPLLQWAQRNSSPGHGHSHGGRLTAVALRRLLVGCAVAGVCPSPELHAALCHWIRAAATRFDPATLGVCAWSAACLGLDDPELWQAIVQRIMSLLHRDQLHTADMPRLCWALDVACNVLQVPVPPASVRRVMDALSVDLERMLASGALSQHQAAVCVVGCARTPLERSKLAELANVLIAYSPHACQLSPYDARKLRLSFAAACVSVPSLDDWLSTASGKYGCSTGDAHMFLDVDTSRLVFM